VFSLNRMCSLTAKKENSHQVWRAIWCAAPAATLAAPCVPCTATRAVSEYVITARVRQTRDRSITQDTGASPVPPHAP
jgi:hypothetical protein